MCKDRKSDVWIKRMLSIKKRTSRTGESTDEFYILLQFVLDYDNQFIAVTWCSMIEANMQAISVSWPRKKKEIKVFQICISWHFYCLYHECVCVLIEKETSLCCLEIEPWGWGGERKSRETWSRMIGKVMEKIRKAWTELKWLAQDRSEWWKFCLSSFTGNC